jgi:hypothetical protein
MKTDQDTMRSEQNILKIIIAAIIGFFILDGLFITIHDMFFVDRPHSREVTSISNLYSLGHGLKEYANDNDGRLPIVTSDSSLFEVLHPRYVPAFQSFHSPLTETDFLFNRSLSGRRISSLSGRTVVLYDPTPSRQSRYDARLGRCVLYLDGQAGWIWENDWPATKAASQIR